jgi:hypothetical protein
MANSVTPDDVDVFLDNAAWVICSTYHMILKAFPDAANFGCNMLFDIPFVADWHKIGVQRQSGTDRGNQRKNTKCVVGRLYSVQYKSIFGVPDKVRCDTCAQVRPLSRV